MDLIRDNKRAAAAIGAGVVLVVVATLLMLLKGHSGNDGGTVIGAPMPTQSASPHLKRKQKHKGTGKAGANGATAADGIKGFMKDGGAESLTGMGFPGLPGAGFSSSLPKIPIVLSVHSSAPIGTVGYIVPTSPDKNYGVAKNVGTSWSLTTYGYGRPDYAQIFIQAGWSGASITCTVTVKGRVTDQRSTSGPYGRALCQG